MLADRIRMSVFKSVSKGDDPLGSIGSQDLIMGNSMAGYFGTVNGLITHTELVNLMGMTGGVGGSNTDITFHKFVHKGRILLFPQMNIKTSISWDNIQSKDGVKGKAINISGQEYLCRLMTGARHYYTSNPAIGGGEWNDLIVEFHVNNGGILTDNDLNISKGSFILCQEIYDGAGLTYRVTRGRNSYNDIQWRLSSDTGVNNVWRPVLEVL